MSSKNRRQYLTATILDQSLLDACHDNLECRLELACEIEAPGGAIIYASDRNKYVGSIFYEALLVFPVIGRTVGEWLSNELQFSTLTLELSNVDGRFNQYLQGGANYGGWVGKSVTVRLGLAEQAGTYKTIFKGKITDVGGFKRSVKSITVIARDDYDRVNVNFPTTTLTEATYPKLEPKNVGKLLPIIYGDWTVATEPANASVPAFILNGNDPLVTFKEKSALLSGPTSPAIGTTASHSFDANDPVQLSTSGTLPAPFVPATTYYIKAPLTQDQYLLSLTPGGAAINSTTAGTGDHKIIAAPGSTRRSVQTRISENDLVSLTSVYLRRADDYFLVPTSQRTIGAGNKTVTISQNTANLWVGGLAYLYESSDQFYVLCTGKNLGIYSDNLVAQAKDMLMTFGGLLVGDFHANWDTYRDKASPSQSAISTIKSRAWIGESTPVLTYALSMLEQVRLEAFIDKDLKLKMNALHFEDWVAAPTHILRNWDVVRDSFQTSIDERNNFNAAQAVFNYLPDVNENAWATSVYRNTLAINQVGKRIAKKVVFPNLYEKPRVIEQLIEILRLASSTFETIATSLTWRSILLDIGDFAMLRVQIGSTVFDDVPAMVRDVGIDPQGLKPVLRLWSMAMTPFGGYAPGYAGTVGGSSATIDEET